MFLRDEKSVRNKKPLYCSSVISKPEVHKSFFSFFPLIYTRIMLRKLRNKLKISRLWSNGWNNSGLDEKLFSGNLIRRLVQLLLPAVRSPQGISKRWINVSPSIFWTLAQLLLIMLNFSLWTNLAKTHVFFRC